MLRVWCAPHQIDTVVKSAAENINEGSFIKGSLIIVRLPAVSEQIDHHDGLQLSKEDKPVGLYQSSPKLLQIASPVDNSAHQGEAP